MSKAVFIQNPDSIYDDRPGEAYHFPRRYLGMVRETIGDWVVFYEGRRGLFGYTGVQKVERVEPDPKRSDHYYAILDRQSAWSFETIVPRASPSGQAYETSLRGLDGRPISGGAAVSAVRRLTDTEFAAIVQYGLTEIDGPDALPRSPEDNAKAAYVFSDEQTPFDAIDLNFSRPDVLASRKYRDPSFQRQVKAAYGSRCAISGLDLRNGGGRPEVQAAHIRPVAHGGPDLIQNALALSGTLHWMFDRGLVSVAEDLSILVSHNKVPPETAARLIVPGQRLLLPENPRHRPHPEFLRFHRETIYGQIN